MSPASLPFIAALLLLAGIFFYLPGVTWRRGVLAFCNAGFLYLLIPDVASGLALAIFLLSGYAVAFVLNKRPNSFVLSVYLVTLIAAFLVLRKYDLVLAALPESLAAHTISIIGLSYMLFRQIHFLVDTMQDQVERLSLWTYLNYQLNFFSLLSGPIQRYQDFDSDWQELKPVLEDRHSVQMAFLRILIGLAKLALVAPVFQVLYSTSADALVRADGGTLSLSRGDAIFHFFGILYFFPIYLYLNFSGYCDLMIAGASLVGMRLPENFDRPYLARNVIDFWTRFHRTLGFWIRDYLFLPLYKWVAERWPKRADSLAFLCYFVAFFLAGVWHGPTANFAVFGLLQAVGASAAKLWERHIQKSRGRAGLKQYLQSSRARALAIFGTVNFECLSILFFPVDIQTTLKMLRAVSHAVI